MANVVGNAEVDADADGAGAEAADGVGGLLPRISRSSANSVDTDCICFDKAEKSAEMRFNTSVLSPE